MIALTLDEEFWSNVSIGEVTDCWRWREVEGYGTFVAEGQTIMAHRYAWSFAYGDIPRGMLVLHCCDNKWCVNPRHLRLGTTEENNIDKTILGRVRAVVEAAQQKHAAAEAHLATLNREPVIKARTHSDARQPSRVAVLLRASRKAARLSQQQIADATGVSQPCVARWERGVTLPRNLASVAGAYGINVDALAAAYVADRDLEVSP